ncbi:hypothetical protein BHE74_00016829 [Ensete ventricosum]|nr:hypothetical protein BHE74_00016829 [Ensete ventricosum]
MMWALEYYPDMFAMYEEPELINEKNEVSKGKVKSIRQFGKFERENIKNGTKASEAPLPITVFLVASVLKEKSARLIQEARGLDDVVKAGKERQKYDAIENDRSTTYMYKRSTPGAAQGGLSLSLSIEIKREEAPVSEGEMSDFTLRNNANLIIGGTSPGTHHPGESLILKEQLHKIRRRTRTEVKTRVKHPHVSSSDYTALGPSCTHGLNPVVLTPQTRQRTHNIWP